MSKQTKYKIIKNKLGYYEIENKPTEKELSNYYTKKYYNSDKEKGLYKIKYEKEELDFIDNYSKRIYDIIKSKIMDKTFLDIGCGEGFSLKNFKNFGFEVTGIDYSSTGIKNHNISLIKNFIQGNIYESIDDLIKQNKKYSLINLQNVLEHVINPINILHKIKKLLNKNGILVIQVPNDFSLLQKHLKNNNYIDKDFWVSPPDHLSYFTLDSLKNISEFCDYEVIYSMSDYPIDFDLLEDHTNYTKKEVGKHSHLKRIRVENFMCNISISKTNDYYNKLCELGCGRTITIFLKPK